MKNIRRNTSILILVIAMLLSVLPASGAAGEITITGPAKLIMAGELKTQGTVFHIPLAAELDGDKSGFVKSAVGYTPNQVWFDDNYMYYTKDLNTTDVAKEVTVHCAKNGSSAEKTIKVIPYIEENFEAYTAGTLANNLTSASHYTWDIKGSYAKVTETTDSVGSYKYLYGQSAANAGRIMLTDAIDSSFGSDVTIEFALARDSYTVGDGVPGIMLRAADSSTPSQDILFFTKKTSSTKLELYSSASAAAEDTSVTNFLKDWIRTVGTTNKVWKTRFTRVKLVVRYNAGLKYDLYIDDVLKGENIEIDGLSAKPWIKYILFASCTDDIKIYSGERVQNPLNYIINEDFSSWTQGAKYYNGSVTAQPENALVDVNKGDENTGYMMADTIEGTPALKAHFEQLSQTSTQYVRYTSSTTANRFLVELKTKINNNGARTGIYAVGTLEGTSIYPELFNFAPYGGMYSSMSNDSINFRNGEWSTVQLLIDTASGAYETYLNGIKFQQGTDTDFIKNFVPSQFRYGVFLRNQVNAFDAYVDYFRVAEVSNDSLSMSKYSTEFVYDGMYFIDQDILIGSNEINAAALKASIEESGKTVRITDANGTETTTGNLGEGYSINVTSPNGINVCRYEISTATYRLGLGSITNDDNSYDAVLSVNRMPGSEFNGNVILCEYEGDKLINAVKSSVIENEQIIIHYTPLSETSSIRAYAWQSLENMIPLTEFDEVK